MVDAAAAHSAIGVVGRGELGRVVARTLAAHGPVLAYDETAGAIAGAPADLASVARGCNTVLLCLPDATAVSRAVAELAPAAPGLLLLDASVLTPEEARPIADAALAEGSTYVQTPITEAVEDVGRWTVQMSGPPAAYPTVARLLAPLATDVVHVGAVGGGAV